MPRIQGPAFILRTWDFGESDLLVSFFSPEGGKCRGIAKGAKKSKRRFGGILSPLFLVQLEYFEKPGNALVRLEGCTLLHYYPSFFSDLSKLLIGCCLLEILEKVLQEGQSSEELFQLLQRTLDRMDREDKAEYLLWVFLLRCLSLLGMGPELGTCIHCRRVLARGGMFGFSVPCGGPVCGGCIRKGTSTHRAHSETLLLLQRWCNPACEDLGVSGVPAVFLREAEIVLEDFFYHHVSREFRALGVLRKVRKRKEAYAASSDHRLEEKGRVL